MADGCTFVALKSDPRTNVTIQTTISLCLIKIKVVSKIIIFIYKMYVLFETAGGFALFKVIKDKKVEKVDNLH